MKIGDKVRLLRSNDEGRIVRFADKNLVEIEIEQGFVIPTLRSDVVIVSSEESEYFGDKTLSGSTARSQTSAPEEMPSGISGVFLGFIPINDNDVSLYLFNFTHRDVLYAISENHDGMVKAYSHGTCLAGKNQFITYFKMNNFESWPQILAQAIYINQGLEPKKAILECIVRLKAKSFFNSKRIIPTIDKEGFLVEVKNNGDHDSDTDSDDNNHKKDTQTGNRSQEGPGKVGSLSEQLKTQLMTQKSNPGTQAALKNRAGENLEVDLHIEKIDPAHTTLSADEIINKQMTTFEKELDNALLSNASNVKFIHGIGNGTLRHKIHKYLSQSRSIRYFEDADKGKFGFGATVVHL